ncbi:hypothetical protein FC820_07200 [Clostridium sporogenes]|uniref:hypothetical protein n=2 Tax=Clostridium sporogenes TaxID=1509 RepID=UPI0013D24DB3|nr:hypothetical protein [Clostridium sporogenes]NFG68121.1 hypothetical protein [Clostridium sporogenes]
MKKNGVYLFEKNTDAVGTNRGLLYQYLITLKDWINNYISKNDQDIFCEFEDDIKEVRTLANEVVFKQIKNYNSPFNINSEEIGKSLYNFYMLYLKYKEKFKIQFYFITNSHISRQDSILTKWSKRTDIILVKNEVAKILSNKVILEKNNKINALDNRIKKYSENFKKNTNKIDEANKKKKKVEENAIELIEKINNYSTITEFIECVFFEFKNQECDYSVQALKDEILINLSKIDKCKGMNNIYFSRFLSEVNQKSCVSNTYDRALTIDLFEEILKETISEIGENTKDEFIEMVTNNFENINNKLDKVNENISELNKKVLGSTIIKNNISLPIYSDDQLKYIIETDGNSSHLEEKIKKIGMDEEDTGYLINSAQNTRCRYLLYKEELKKNNLNEELSALQSLEGILRRVCFEKVQEYTYKLDFNSRQFWYKLIGELKKITIENELFLEYKFQDDIIYGQMYEIAAQCPLRWHKK